MKISIQCMNKKHNLLNVSLMQAGERIISLIVFLLMDKENTWKCWKRKQGVMMYSLKSSDN